MNRLKGFIATPFVVIGAFLFFLGMVIIYGLEFTIEYVDKINTELDRMKKSLN